MGLLKLGFELGGPGRGGGDQLSQNRYITFRSRGDRGAVPFRLLGACA